MWKLKSHTRLKSTHLTAGRAWGHEGQTRVPAAGFVIFWHLQSFNLKLRFTQYWSLEMSAAEQPHCQPREVDSKPLILTNVYSIRFYHSGSSGLSFWLQTVLLPETFDLLWLINGFIVDAREIFANTYKTRQRESEIHSNKSEKKCTWI